MRRQMLEHIVMDCCAVCGDGLWSMGMGGENLSVMFSVVVTVNIQIFEGNFWTQEVKALDFPAVLDLWVEWQR